MHEYFIPYIFFLTRNLRSKKLSWNISPEIFLKSFEKARFYPNVNMILYEDFSQYVGRDHEFCIDARMYYKYSKLLVPGYEFDLKTCDPKSRINGVLNCSNMKNDINFNLSIEWEVRENRGSVQTNRYMMNPESFYRLLMDIPDRYRKARQTFGAQYHRLYRFQL